MRKDKNPKQAQMRTRIAAAAARMMAEDGIDDFAQAKRKAARALGATDTQALPGNDEVEAELRSYLALYQSDEHADRLRALRETALEVMEHFAEHRPYLAGSVLKGTASRFADIDIQLFTDDPKGVELQLLNDGLPYETSEQRLYVGDDPRQVPVFELEWTEVPVRIALCDRRDERAALKTSPSGRPIERANLTAVEQLVGEEVAAEGDEDPGDDADTALTPAAGPQWPRG